MIARSVALALLAATAASAQSPLPEPSPLPPPIPAARDVAWPGTMRLEVDATDLQRRIFRVRQTIPVEAAGPITLLYPEWLPGNHAPRGPIDKIAGLTIRAGGQTLAWKRHPADVYAIQVEVPQGASALDVDFQFVSPTAPAQGRVVMTPEMLNLQWEKVAFYPAGRYVRRIMVEPSVRLPTGWGYGVALETAAEDGDLKRFRPVDFETLVDSPMFAGRNFRRVVLDDGPRPQVRLNIVADAPADLAPTDAQIRLHRNLVEQGDKLFGVRPFDHYDFLLAVTGRLGGIGLEHHRSSENSVATHYFTDWKRALGDRDLLPHEYVHAWNGKLRRPADLMTRTYSEPMRGSLLWVYEGQTQYWGYVLGARAGMLSADEALESLAMTAATYENRVGRAWRPLEDTGQEPVISARRPEPWPSWQRPEDYYSEGQLIWLDADTLIREKSGGRRSLDDFAKRFFGGKDGDFTPRTYTFDDVVAALDAVEPHDWASFLRTRVQAIAPKAPLDGLARGGWRLTYADAPTGAWTATEAEQRNTNLTYSLGLVLNREGDVTAVQWDGPAFQAGLSVGAKILAVNGLAYDADRLKQAIRDAKTGGPIELLTRNGDHFRTVQIAYRGGLRYPKLERIAGTPDRLTAIYSARK
ncbi:M61 family metallopeptidase [Phenylobacterium sp.]|jgi:predicted metalloprotease with PDZ domain|uniref:M61 family metallopeptidase n=1 Tax=Phenylobacterium sp. TaxID=1871053 RepID=UPI003783F5F0